MKSITIIHRGIRLTIAVLYGFVGWMAMITGWAYLPWTSGPATLPDALVQLTSLFPLWVWGAAWTFAGVLLIAAAVTQLRRRWFAVSMGALLFMQLLFAIFYSIAYFSGDPRGYVAAVIYLREAALVLIVATLIAVLRPKVPR
jgi:hypothetical protein